MLQESRTRHWIVDFVTDYATRKGKPPPAALTEASSLSDDVYLDSLDRFDLLLELEDRVGAPLDPDEAGEAVTLADIIAFVEAACERPRTGLEGGAVSIRDFEQYLADNVPQFLNEVTAQRGRKLMIGGRWVADFASANYLGLDLHREVMDAIPDAVEEWGVHPSWTRVVASPKIYTDLEDELARMVGAPETLVFPTITLTHLGVLPLLTGPNGVLLIDSRAHRSIHEAGHVTAARGAKVEQFTHLDMNDLVRKLEAYKHRPSKIVAVDGVYSMTGRELAVAEIAEICRRYDARLYIDDAHGFGILGHDPNPAVPYGRGGGGLVRKAGLDYVRDNIVYVAGMSKAFSSLAAFVTCRDGYEKRLLSAASTWVFSGPCPTASLATSLAGIRISMSEEGEQIRRRLYTLTRRFVDGARDCGLVVENDEYFPLASIVIGSVKDVVKACQILWEHGVLITPAVYPNVPLTQSMLRFTLTAANTEEEVDRALEALQEVRDLIPGAPIQARPNLVA